MKNKYILNCFRRNYVENILGPTAYYTGHIYSSSCFTHLRVSHNYMIFNNYDIIGDIYANILGLYIPARRNKILLIKEKKIKLI